MNRDDLNRLIRKVIPGAELDYDTGNWFGVRAGKHWFAVDKRQQIAGTHKYFGSPYRRDRLLAEIKKRWQEVQEDCNADLRRS